jgi:hypothetical protein
MSDHIEANGSIMDDKHQVISGAIADDIAKHDLHLDDEAGEVAVQALVSGPVEAEASKSVLKKIDKWILPFLMITYGN